MTSRRPIWIFLLPVCVWSCASLLAAGQNHGPTHLAKHYPASSRYQSIIPSLEETFRGPIRLPRKLIEVRGSDNLYPQLYSVSAHGYQVIYAATSEPCEGQHVCSWGSMVATDVPQSFDAPGQKVLLSKGLVGYFHKMSCGAYCGEAYVEWREGKFSYTVGIKAGSRRDLIAAADSAINIAHSQQEARKIDQNQ